MLSFIHHWTYWKSGLPSSSTFVTYYLLPNPLHLPFTSFKFTKMLLLKVPNAFLTARSRGLFLSIIHLLLELSCILPALNPVDLLHPLILKISYAGFCFPGSPIFLLAIFQTFLMAVCPSLIFCSLFNLLSNSQNV